MQPAVAKKKRERLEEFPEKFTALAESVGEVVFDRLTDRSRQYPSFGILRAEAEEVIFDLCADDYYRGPSLHHQDSRLHVWEFGKKLRNGEMAYIKLFIDISITGDSEPICLSFHSPESPIDFPLQRIPREDDNE